MSAKRDNGIAVFLSTAQRAMESGDDSTITEEELRQLLTAAIRLYSNRSELTGNYPVPISSDQANATDVLIVVSELIRAADLNPFDVSMWYRRQK
jgi:hypothetical protein